MNATQDTLYPSMKGTLAVLKKMGFDPKFALDIGAYEGSFTEMFKSVFPKCGVVMFEPLASKKDALVSVCKKHSDVGYLDHLLAGFIKHVPFYEMETGSSLYQEQSHYARRIRVMSTSRLDDLLGINSGRVDFIKLDVQGAELDVLSGGQTALRKAEAVLLEVSLVPINKGCPLMDAVVTYMSDAGFVLFDICDMTRRNDGILWQTDLMFVKRGGSLVPNPRLTQENWH